MKLDMHRSLFRCHGAALALCVTSLLAGNNCLSDVGTSSVPSGPAFYVSPTGSDTNAGTIDAPFLTLARARDAARAVNKKMTNDLHIYLRGGTYFLPAPLALDKGDSGTNGHRIFYQAYPGEHPILSGGTPVTGWAIQDPAKNIYKAKVGPLANSRQLYVNGTRAVRARSVDAKDWKPAPDGYDCPPEVATWRNPEQIEVVQYHNYMLNRGPIQSVNGTHAAMAYPYWSMMHQKARRAAPSYIENAYELLDADGEWYLDRAQATLYYKPRPGENMASATVVLPRLEKLVLGSNVSNVCFQGLTFAHATWLAPNLPSGFRNHGGNVYQDNPSEALVLRKEIQGNVVFSHSNNVALQGNVFEHLGGVGLELAAGSKKINVHDNIFRDISASGASIGSQAIRFPSDEDWVKDITFDNNLVQGVAVEYQSSSGVCCGFTESVKVTHNEICDLPLSAVKHGGYPEEDYSGSRSRDNHIDYNYIHDYATLSHWHEGGAIYVIGTSELAPVSTMSFNYINNRNARHQPEVVVSLYMDNWSQGWQANSNVVNIAQGRWAYWLYMQTKPVPTKNLSADNNYTTSTTIETNGNPVTSTHYFPDANWPQQALDIMHQAGRARDKKQEAQVAPAPAAAR